MSFIFKLAVVSLWVLANLDSQIEIITNRMRTSHIKREPHRNLISL